MHKVVRALQFALLWQLQDVKLLSWESIWQQLG